MVKIGKTSRTENCKKTKSKMELAGTRINRMQAYTEIPVSQNRKNTECLIRNRINRELRYAGCRMQEGFQKYRIRESQIAIKRMQVLRTTNSTRLQQS